MFRLLLLACTLVSWFCRPDGIALALTDEIQVYDAEICELGKFNLTWHNNFTAIGHRQPDLPGGIVLNHTLNGVPEWAYGVTEWFEVGLYLPVYSLTGGGRFLIDSGKLRALFVTPHAAEKIFFYGMNFELGYNSKHWDMSRRAGEVRPIIGRRIGPVEVIVNPIFDTDFRGFRRLDFVPCERLGYNLSKTWAAALEHYEDCGRLDDLAPLGRQDQTVFVVVD
jgi:hypothetical protein